MKIWRAEQNRAQQPSFIEGRVCQIRKQRQGKSDEGWDGLVVAASFSPSSSSGATGERGEEGRVRRIVED